MAQTKILLDTNSYFRLAKSTHPLLDEEFGKEKYCLYVLKELDVEFARNKRLQTKFSWVDEKQYFENRQKKLTLSKKDKRSIDLTVDILRQYKIDILLSVSDIDILCLAYSHVLDVYVVTDDTDMLELGDIFSIKHMKTLNLLKLMLECEHVDFNKVKQIVAYWEYISDKPAKFRQDYIALFDEKPP